MRIKIDSNRMCRIIDPAMRGLRTYTPEFAGMEAGGRALDICCGTGSQVLQYARMGIIADGIDLDPRMIKVAETNSKKQGLTTASFQTANAINLPFKDRLFDYASISMALHEKERMDRDRIITEMKRVLKEEGTLVFTDYKAPLPRIPSSYLSTALEYISGRDHWRCFQDYTEQGGLDGLLKKHNLHEGKRDELGPLWIIITRNLRG
jgi:demethylmenaquinone methyltransferase/2-methoxy-6-polyprenyl-1,4-benzoquinol methylase